MNRKTYIVSSGPWHEKIKALIARDKASRTKLESLIEKYGIDQAYSGGDGRVFLFEFNGKPPKGFKKHPRGGYTFAKKSPGPEVKKDFSDISFLTNQSLQEALGFHVFYFFDGMSLTSYFITMEPSPCGEKYKLTIPDCGEPYEVPEGVKKVDVEALVWEAGE